VTLSADLLGSRYRRGPHVETWFLEAVEPGGARGLWLRATIFARPKSADRRVAPVPPVAEAWAVAFDRERGHVATKTVVPLEAARFGHGNVDLAVDGCELSLGHARGAIDNGGRSLAWDLEVGPSRAAPIRHLPSHALYDDRVPSGGKAVTPVSDARASGTLRVRRSSQDDEERWDVAAWPTMIGHHWGRGRPHLYAWSHCGAWDDAEDLVFEGISTRVRMGPMLSPMGTAVFIRWRGRSWDLNARELFGKNRGIISMRRWEVTATGERGVRVHAEIDAATDDLVGLHYPNPGGGMTYGLDTALARARVELLVPGEPPLVATSRSAALEIGTRDRHHGVRMYV
jgi:hypothetical protein